MYKQCLREASAQELAQPRKLKVFLGAVGNPDRGQDPSRPPFGVVRKTVRASTLAEASSLCRQYIVDNDLGGGNWAAVEVREDVTCELVATVSYNGRVWIPVGGA